MLLCTLRDRLCIVIYETTSGVSLGVRMAVNVHFYV